MLDVNLIRYNPDIVKEGIIKKNADPKLVDKFLRFDERWRQKTTALNQLKAEQNILSKELAKERSDHNIARAQVLKKRIGELVQERDDLDRRRNEILRQLPNLPLPDTPPGKDENENKVLREVGLKPKFNFKPKDYLTLSEALDLIDVKRAAKVSGSRFGYLKNEAVLFEFGLVKLAFDVLIKEGFHPVVPPVMIKEEMMSAMGYIDNKIDQAEAYYFEKDKLYFVGTSEQSIGPMHAGEIFKKENLPKRYVAFSTCFRREAGSYGKDTKGILRVHQFDKVEMFSFCEPDKSPQEHLYLLSLQERLMSLLEIPYRVLKFCAGALGNVAAAKYDIEAWLPGQNQYRETHSTTNATDFQARRLNIKISTEDEVAAEKNQYVHTLNGTAFAVGRIIIAIIENYQTKDGKIKVPEVLQPFVGKKIIG